MQNKLAFRLPDHCPTFCSSACTCVDNTEQLQWMCGQVAPAVSVLATQVCYAYVLHPRVGCDRCDLRLECSLPQCCLSRLVEQGDTVPNCIYTWQQHSVSTHGSNIVYLRMAATDGLSCTPCKTTAETTELPVWDGIP